MNTLRQLFALRNIVPLTTIVLAFLGITGLIQNPTFTTDKLILTLLGILAIDAIVERLGYLNKIERDLRSLNLTAIKPLFVNRAALNSDEPFEQFVKRGRDVLIIGVSLVGIVGPLRTFFKTTVQQGTKIRFLLLDPDSVGIQSIARSHGVTPESMRNDIKSSLGYLQQLLDACNGNESGTLEVRLFQAIPCAGIVVRDGDRDTGQIRCEMYLFQTDVAGRPAFLLRASDGEIFRRFRDAAERAWRDSLPWTPDSSTHSAQ